jgi:DNA-binding NarL/FixJ family response regulator
VDTVAAIRGKAVAQLCENIPAELATALRRHCEFVENGIGGTRPLRALARQRRAEVAVVDLDGIESRDREDLRALAHELPELRLLLLGSSQNLAWVQSWLTIGAHSYLHKLVPAATVVRAMLSPERTAGISIHLPLQRMPEPPAAVAAQLSQREVQVLELAADAMSNRQIARSLDITEGTVKRHMGNIFRKLDSCSRIDSVNKARTFGLISGERNSIPH